MSASPIRAHVVHFDRLVERAVGAFVVIDVLRATTAIVCALANGAREIVPVAAVEAARERAASLGALLGGEENNAKIEGFDFGNSPREYDERVRDRTIVLRTTNGTRALEALRGEAPVVCGAFANLSSVVRALGDPSIATVTLVCAGQAGEFSLEDFACAGAIVDGLEGLREVRCDDEAIAARELFRARRHDLAALLHLGNHARSLQRAGYAGDIDFAAQIDRYDVLPTLSGDSVAAARQGGPAARPGGL
jgi:2-phosphosulfolactate phosphatase